ncbi:hypothetical protein DOM22_02095 [Bdellovibrio sp. ZAP7]|uniref:hypothetical protein n=1 Tax=Bdellovibrio sp. ZAP7 TaxID=2231053 RepID=UPI0011598D9A|nr:hypothetical protein [Bdellovibrio sp. ZAP7]QDK44035.1 hypothetical protein DOM22_02095 [Bdellovibrio sp. ZAP7]
MKKIVLVFALLLSVTAGAQEKSADEIAAMKEDDSKSAPSSGPGSHSGHFVLGAYLNTLSDMKFKDAKSTTGSTTTAAEYDLKSSASLGIDAHFLFWGEQAWGFSVGGFFDLGRKVKSESVAIFGTTKDEYLGIIGFEGNAIYRFKQLYIPFGLNSSLPVIGLEDSEITDLQPGVGVQAGVGYMISAGNALEAKVRTTAFGYTQTVNNVKLETGRGTGVGLVLGWKYVF